MNTWAYLERLRALNGDCSDYRLAKLLGVQQPAMVRYRQGREMDDDVAARVAELLGVPPLKVIADVRAARAEAEGQANLVAIWRQAALLAVGKVLPMPKAAPALATARAGGKARTRALRDSNSRPSGSKFLDRSLRHVRRRRHRTIPRRAIPSRCAVEHSAAAAR